MATSRKVGVVREKVGVRGVSKSRKLYVLDTNVLLHDPQSLLKFREHDVFIPFVTIEELDNKKVGSSDLNQNARAAIRLMDAVMEASGEGDLHDGFSLGNFGVGMGRMFVQTEQLAFLNNEHVFKNDNMYLAVLEHLKGRYPQHRVVMVTKDLNLRIKARALGHAVEDYKNDQLVEDAQLIERGIVKYETDWFLEVEGVSSRKVDNRAVYFVNKEAVASAWEARTGEKFKPWVSNMFLDVENVRGGSRLYRVLGEEGFDYKLRVVTGAAVGKAGVFGLKPRTEEQEAALELLLDPEVDFVALLGPAGTGKTLLTVAAACSQMMGSKGSQGVLYDKMLFTRVTIPLGEDVGFLPGTEEEKMLPWVGALNDNMEVLEELCAGGGAGAEGAIGKLQELKKTSIEVKAMTFMRGRTLNRRFLVIDEAQNMTPKQMRALITRAGEGTKVVCLGNLAQIDSPYLSETSSGLTYVVEKFRGWPHFGALILEKGERSRLANEANERLK